MVIGNVQIYTEEKVFKPGVVRVGGDRIAEVCLWDASEGADVDFCREEEAMDCLDGKGAYLIPGMIDIHLHGCLGYDFCDGTVEAVHKIAEYQVSVGVTTFAPATMTLPVERLVDILRVGARYQQEKREGKHGGCADLAGINMEGPFISKRKKGAQKEENIIGANVATYRRFQQAADGLVKYIGLAPEEENALDFISQVKEEVKVTLAHSNADYTTAMEALKAGATHVTHLYNAMPEYNHREPGIIGAVYDSKQVEAELICDGVHVHPSVIRGTFSILGSERIILISDSMRAAGMPDGEYELGGQKVSVRGNRAMLENGTIAGSVSTVPECFLYAVKEAGVPLEEAVACVTSNPAKSLGIYEECGSITPGKRADLVLLDQDLKAFTVIKAGRVIV